MPPIPPLFSLISCGLVGLLTAPVLRLNITDVFTFNNVTFASVRSGVLSPEVNRIEPVKAFDRA